MKINAVNGKFNFRFPLLKAPLKGAFFVGTHFRQNTK